MTDKAEYMNRVLDHLAELLDVPPSRHEQAEQRYRSLGEWLEREESSVAVLDPHVFSQGSFRLGTATRPLLREDEYDLDLVCRVGLTKADTTQQGVKQLIGDEVKAYAEARHIKAPPTEKKRCWRLDYADEVSFHMDILPAIPDDAAVRLALTRAGVAEDLTAHALAITDNTRPDYKLKTGDWPRSNPEGFARWFESRMRQAEVPAALALVRKGVYASIDDVPAHKCKTTLQRVVQLLKRHRDVMFKDHQDVKPISIIITTLSARAYTGEVNLHEALAQIIDQMPQLVRTAAPRIPNPVNPAEDFADKWASNPRLEDSFWLWHTQAREDLERLADPAGVEPRRKAMQAAFALPISADVLQKFGGGSAGVADGEAGTPPHVHIKSGTQPWQSRG